MMSRFKLFIEYDGTRYSGWQIQKNARTIQGELADVATRIFSTSRIEITGAGRTDAGVHALCQVAHLDVQTMLAPEIIRMKMNDDLPSDICIIEVEKAGARFHARHDALARSYLYQISRRRTAFGKRYVWWIKDPLNVSAMKAAALRFVGFKDFRSFTADDADEKSTSVLLENIQLEGEDDLILIRIVGSHFLWKMVRQMVGVLVEVGRGSLTGHDIDRLFRQPSDLPAKLTAPPSGLFLERVYYTGDNRFDDLVPVLPIRTLHLRKSASRAHPSTTR